MKCLFLFFSLCISNTLLAQNKYLVILGGGGEPVGPFTMFDTNLSLMGDFSKKHPEYKVDLSFNGGHTQTERLIKEKFKTYSKDQFFTQDHFEKMILKYEQLIESGEIKAGDNLLLSINTHGSVKNGETHNISTIGASVTDYNNLSEKTVNLDRLKKLTVLAEKKGINLGIIDLSCHSGNTLAIANSKTCVISGAGPEHFGVGGLSEQFFSNAFPKQLNSALTLEEAFLKARKGRVDITFPMISSPQGKHAQDLLYDSMTPYLHYYTIIPDKFIDFMEEDLMKGKQCRVESGFEKLNFEIEKLLKLSSEFSVQSALKELKEALRAYHDYIVYLKEEMNRAGIGIMKKKHEFCATIPADPNLKVPEIRECLNYYSLQQLMMLEYKTIYSFYEGKISDIELGPMEKAQNMAILECYKKAEKWKNYIISNNPNFLLVNDFWKKYPHLSTQTKNYAFDVMQAEQQVYNLLYQSSKSKSPNPCQNFKL